MSNFNLSSFFILPFHTKSISIHDQHNSTGIDYTYNESQCRQLMISTTDTYEDIESVETIVKNSFCLISIFYMDAKKTKIS